VFRPKNTGDGSASYHKVLLYGHHGWGKTTQCLHMQKRYGPGFILSGEAGLISIADAGIDYLPFTSWDGETDPSRYLYSFRDLFRWLRTDEFKERGYQWVCIDSLTELSDMSMKSATAAAEAKAMETGKKVDGFAIWSDHAANLIGACKAMKGLSMHVLMTCLAKESSDENGNVEFWPMVQGKQAQQQLPGIFDHVFCGVRASVRNTETGDHSVVRYVVTDEVRGWHGKARDEHRRLRPVEKTGNIVELLDRVSMNETDYERWRKTSSATPTTTDDNKGD